MSIEPKELSAERMDEIRRNQSMFPYRDRGELLAHIEHQSRQLVDAHAEIVTLRAELASAEAVEQMLRAEVDFRANSEAAISQAYQRWRDRAEKAEARVAEFESRHAMCIDMVALSAKLAVAETRIDELESLLRDTHRHLSEAYWDAAVGAEAYPPAVELQLRRVDQAIASAGAEKSKTKDEALAFFAEKRERELPTGQLAVPMDENFQPLSADPSPGASERRTTHTVFFVEERRGGYWLSDGPEFSTLERAREKHEENLREGFTSQVVRVTEIRDVIAAGEE
jgi:hypothetical protein